jgi:hypothetical protein
MWRPLDRAVSSSAGFYEVTAASGSGGGRQVLAKAPGPTY